jgi:hypothetical protein
MKTVTYNTRKEEMDVFRDFWYLRATQRCFTRRAGLTKWRWTKSGTCAPRSGCHAPRRVLRESSEIGSSYGASRSFITRVAQLHSSSRASRRLIIRDAQRGITACAPRRRSCAPRRGEFYIYIQLIFCVEGGTLGERNEILSAICFRSNFLNSCILP